MKKNISGIFLIALLAMFIIGVSTVFAETKTPAISVDGVPLVPSSPLILEKGSFMIAIDDLGMILNANTNWNATRESVYIQKHGKTILFKIAENVILKNAKPFELTVGPRLVGEIFYVPLRKIIEGLGAKVNWDEKNYQIQIKTGERFMPPETLEREAFNAMVAYTDNGHLWLLDGREENSQPKMITDTGYAELIGWSNDGQWLAYKYFAKGRSEEAFLWVVSADGSHNRPIDTVPVYDNYQWSPNENKIAYTTYGDTDSGFVPTGVVKCADITESTIHITNLMKDNTIAIPSIAWHPEGKSLSISIPRTKNKPPTIEMLDLKIIYTYKDNETVDFENIYLKAFISLKWSLDGQYIAYHTSSNSASIAADFVGTALLDTESMKVEELSGGLKYKGWMDFSPDSKMFSYIKGAGRDVQYNKALELVSLADGAVNNPGEENHADSQLVWIKGNPIKLLYCSAPKDKKAFDSADLPGVFVPGQRIYGLSEEGVAAITKDKNDTADYFPNISKDGNQLIFLRLSRYDQGSIYIQPFNEPQNAIEILRGIRGSAGYYGNYYPEWIKVHWY